MTNKGFDNYKCHAQIRLYQPPMAAVLTEADQTDTNTVPIFLFTELDQIDTNTVPIGLFTEADLIDTNTVPIGFPQPGTQWHVCI